MHKMKPLIKDSSASLNYYTDAAFNQTIDLIYDNTINNSSVIDQLILDCANSLINIQLGAACAFCAALWNTRIIPSRLQLAYTLLELADALIARD